MQDHEVINIIQNQLNYSSRSISEIKIFLNELLKANKKHNFISKSTENVIWHRHVLDSAQLVKFIDFSKGSLSDLGSGAGFPGLILALFNKNRDFHVKLYEKSPVKRSFLRDISEKLSLKVSNSKDLEKKTLSLLKNKRNNLNKIKKLEKIGNLILKKNLYELRKIIK